MSVELTDHLDVVQNVTIKAKNAIVTVNVTSLGSINVTMPDSSYFSFGANQNFVQNLTAGEERKFNASANKSETVVYAGSITPFIAVNPGDALILPAIGKSMAVFSGSGGGFSADYDPYAGSILTVKYIYNATPSIKIVKTTNGYDANSPPGPFIPAGNKVTWNYTLNNPGNVALKEVNVTDDRGLVPVYQSGDTHHFGWLDQNETWLYNATGLAVSGQYANNATSEGKSPEDVSVESKDPSHYFGQNPEHIDGQEDQRPGRQHTPGPYIPVAAQSPGPTMSPTLATST